MSEPINGTAAAFQVLFCKVIIIGTIWAFTEFKWAILACAIIETPITVGLVYRYAKEKKAKREAKKEAGA